jgi:hypothetical protein
MSISWADEYRRNVGIETDADDMPLPEIVPVESVPIRSVYPARYVWAAIAGLMAAWVIVGGLW